MTLRWDRRALQDLKDIHSYVAANSSPGSAERVRRHLRNRTDLLASSPLLGVASSNPSIRVLFPTRYPYRIYYTVQGDEVVILHIRHTARRAPDDLLP
ncbi:MAG: type II toxin-antitoxin system RelE/ParE family toxin [Hyphomicrobiaceae bacterium]|jgi:plasmid stabilization system protein ParE